VFVPKPPLYWKVGMIAAGPGPCAEIVSEVVETRQQGSAKLGR